MHISFVIFNIIVLVIIAVSAFFLGRYVKKANEKESPEAKNTTPYEDCLAHNEKIYNYGTFTDARDGETYRTIQIGDQVWMAENLRKKFGRLYTWTSALDIPPEFSEQSPAKDIEMYRKMKDPNYQGIAPEGWHIPSNKEWEQLLSHLSEKSNGRELRSTCFWLEPGYDSFGFFALPAGYRFDNGTFNHFGRRARFWSKDEYGKSNAFRLGLTDNSIDIEGVYRSDAISIRCVKNV